MKNKIINLLISEWYKSYAIILSRLNIELSKEHTSYTDWKTIFIKEYSSNDEISLIIRHEILHWLLNHFSISKEIDNINHNKFNIAADLEISNFYTKEDNKIIKQLWWYTIDIDEYNKYKTTYVIDIYNDLDIDDDEQKWETYVDLSDLSEEDKKEIIESIKKETKEIKGKQELYEVSNNIKIIPIDKKDIFINSIKRYFIREEQIQKLKSFKKQNKKYQWDIIMKWNINKNAPWKTLAVYLDLSWSMDQNKIEQAYGFLNWLNKFKKIKLIKNYFSDTVSSTPMEWGWTNYDAVFKDIIDNKYTDICIITDDDNHQWLSIEVKSSWIIRIWCDKTIIENFIKTKDKFYFNN
jgi:hypothetical protein